MRMHSNTRAAFWHRGGISILLAAVLVAGGAGKLNGADILEAAKAGDAAQVTAAIAADAQAVNGLDKEGNHALILAAKAGSADTITALLKAKAPVNRPNHAGQTALWIAIDAGKLDIAKALVAGGARVDCMATCGTTPLHRAIQMGNLEEVQFLVDKGASVNYLANLLTRDAAGEVQQLVLTSSLHLAIEADNPAILEYLLSHRGDPDLMALKVNQAGPEGSSVPLMAAVQAEKLPMVQVLLKAGAKVNTLDITGNTALHWAVKAGSVEIVKVLLAAKADMNARNLLEQSPFESIDDAKNGAVIKAAFIANGYKDSGNDNAVQMLRMLATAQAQFIKRNDYYSANGKDLGAARFIPPGMATAFESWQKNGDSDKPVAYKGYIFRMLLGDDPQTLTSYLREDGKPSEGMNTWACIARPVNGEGKQYYISEAGTVYGLPDDGKNHFMLTWTPPQDQTEWPTAR